jgi:hypothetical protein
VVVVSCSLQISTYVTKFISEPVPDGMLGCSTVGYCLVSVSHSVRSGQRFFCLVIFTACDSDGSSHNCSFSWLHHMLKCLSLKSMACYTFSFVYSCLTAMTALHDC